MCMDYIFVVWAVEGLCERYSSETIDDDGVTIATYGQGVKQLVEDKKHSVELRLESPDQSFNCVFESIMIDDTSKMMDYVNLQYPPQRYVIKRPAPVVRYSPNKPAEITAELWPPDVNDSIIIKFSQNFNPDQYFVENLSFMNMVYQHPDYNNTDNYDGVTVSVEKENISDLTKFSITIHTKVTGLFLFFVGLLENKVNNERIYMRVESVEDNQATWLDGQPYDVRFIVPWTNSSSPPSSEIIPGAHFRIICKVIGPFKMVELTRDGSQLMNVTYQQNTAWTLYVYYLGNGEYFRTWLAIGLQ